MRDILYSHLYTHTHAAKTDGSTQYNAIKKQQQQQQQNMAAKKSHTNPQAQLLL